MTSFKDHFSRQASTYAKFRPDYPEELYAFIAGQCPSHHLAWDCGTGNGQAALGLARHFDKVIATDPSSAQIENATPHPKVEYRVGSAEHSNLPDASCDLITVAQALHWFDHPAFFAEAKGVLKPGGLLAPWCYTLFRSNPAIDAVILEFYEGTIGPWWPAERSHIDHAYETIPFPDTPRQHHEFTIHLEWDLDQMIGYLRSWSATQRYIKDQQSNPLPQVREELANIWGVPKTQHAIEIPIHLFLVSF